MTPAIRACASLPKNGSSRSWGSCPPGSWTITSGMAGLTGLAGIACQTFQRVCPSFVMMFARAKSRLPASAPAAPTGPASAAHEPDDEQQEDRANRSVCDRGHEACAEMDAETRQDPASDEGADDSNDEIADKPETGA